MHRLGEYFFSSSRHMITTYMCVALSQFMCASLVMPVPCLFLFSQALYWLPLLHQQYYVLLASPHEHIQGRVMLLFKLPSTIHVWGRTYTYVLPSIAFANDYIMRVWIIHVTFAVCHSKWQIHGGKICRSKTDAANCSKNQQKFEKFISIKHWFLIKNVIFVKEDVVILQ